MGSGKPLVFRDETSALIDHLYGVGKEDEAQDLERLVRWRKDPILWANERLGIPEHTLRWALNPGYTDHHWDGTPDPFVAISEALAQGEDVAVESGTGTGKTFFAAIATLWFLDVFREDTYVVTTAPREKQLTLLLWAEIAKLWPRFQEFHPEAKLKKLRIEMTPDEGVKWAAHGVVAGVGANEESATRMQGFHATNMLTIFEECPGIHGAIMTAVEQTSVARNNIRFGLGNPDHKQDSLHKFATEPDVRHVRISALDHPNVVTGEPIIPGAVSRKKVEARRKKDGPDSRIYKSRVRGISPDEAEDSLILWDWCVDATKVDADLSSGPALGVDVANSPNGDLGAIARGTGNRLEEVKTWPCPDANAFARERVAPYLPHTSPDRCGVDNIGVGAGAYNELRRLGYYVRGLCGAETPVHVSGQSERFRNLRAQMWWQMREDIRNGLVRLPDDPELFEDLTAPTWKPVNGKITIQSKDDIRSNLRRSPDKVDAAVYWNWVRQRRTGASKGGRLLTF